MSRVVVACAVAVCHFFPGQALGAVELCRTHAGPDSAGFFGISVSAADVDGDGFPEVVVGAPGEIADTTANRAFLFWGGERIGEPPLVLNPTLPFPNRFGASVSSAGDFNGDGFADVIVGDPVIDFIGKTSAATIYLGGPGMDGVHDVLLPKGEPSFGQAVASAGDVNGDGYADVIVGGPNLNESNGQAELYFGREGPFDPGTGEPPGFVVKGSIGERLGTSTSSAGDFNNDTFADFAIGSPSRSRVYIFFGGTDLGGEVNADDADIILTGNGRFGASISGGRDLNGDQFDDVIVGAPNQSMFQGSAYVFLGGRGPGTYPSTSADYEFTGEGSGDFFGTSVSLTADADADSVPEILIGAELADRAYVFHGGRPAGSYSASDADQVLSGKESGESYGFSVSSTDFNRDGLSDFLVGAPRNDSMFYGGGRVYVFLNNLRPASLLRPPFPGNEGQPTPIQIELGGVALASGVLHYRNGGEPGGFQDLPLRVAGTALLEGLIPASAVTGRGMEYYVTLGTCTGPITLPPMGPAVPAFLPVHFGRPLPPLAGSGEFALFGLPMEPDDGTPGAVLDELGEYDKTVWRLGRYEPVLTGYQDGPDQVQAFAPGLGYWLIQAANREIRAEGTSPPSTGPYPIDLAFGWNQIAHPFLFPVSWANVQKVGDIRDELYGWDPRGQDTTDGEPLGDYVLRPTLRPWEGYWVFSNETEGGRLLIPGVESAGVGSPGSPDLVAGWEIGVYLWGSEGPDQGFIVGNSMGSSVGLDPWDELQPPLPPGGRGPMIRLEEEAAGGPRLIRDIRPRGHSTWKLLTDVPEGTGARWLRFEGVHGVPEGFDVRLTSEGIPGEWDLREEPRIQVQDGESVRFTLTVGPEQPGPPGNDENRSFRLLGAVPNPSRGGARIVFSVPEEQVVELRIFDVRGRLVRELVGGSVGEGWHWEPWDGSDRTGARTPAGVYFVRLQTRKATLTRRLLRLP